VTGGRFRVRIQAAAALLGAAFFLLAVRAMQLTLLEGPRLRARAERQQSKSMPVAARRGAIVDRLGAALALTRESAAVFVRPRELDGTGEWQEAVARLLDLHPDEVSERVHSAAPFVWLKRQVTLDRSSAVERLGIRGIGCEPSRQRIYPQGALAGHVLGFVGIDGQGLEGVERMLDSELDGEVEALVVGCDARGRRYVADGWRRPLPRVGAQVELTLDSGLQRVAEEELERSVREFGASGGTVVVLVPRSGEVLAMANVPRFDPNQFSTTPPDGRRNRAVTDSYEPGSTFKAILAAAALEAAVVTPSDRVFCENGRYGIGGRVIRDAHPHGTLSFTDVIAQSSNICSAKIAERLGPARFAEFIGRFGFGRPSGIDLPGEVGGIVSAPQQWRRINLATIAFGQGIAVTPLQLTRAFAAIANRGRLMRPYIVRRVVSEQGVVERSGAPHFDGEAVSPATAAALTSILVQVTESGTGKLARVDGFSVAGKTGTAQKVDPLTGRYHPRHRMSSFVGFVPADDPELAILVVIDSPTKSTYGGVVAAPVFRRVADYGLARRGVRPPAERRRRPENRLEIASSNGGSEEDEAGVPSYLGLGMREALRRARAGGFAVRIEGSGYVVGQEPLPGTDRREAGQLWLKFGSAAS
jgi:cell division protein FtsI (penicillin-binding protein 3)